MSSVGVSAPGHARPRLPLLRLAQGAALAGLGAFVVHAAAGAGSPGVDRFFDDFVYNGLLLLAAGACFARVAVNREERAAWLALAIGIAAWTAGDLHYAVAYSSTETPPFPSVGDAFYLAFYPASYAALVLLLRSRVREFHRTLWLDGAMAALAVAALGASVLFQVVLETTEGNTAAIATNLAYPLGDVLLLALVAGVFALTGWRPGRTWAYIGGGLLAAALADGLYLFAVASGSYVEGGLTDALWPAAMLLLAHAAWQRPKPPQRIQFEGRRLLFAPAVCGLVGVGVLAFDHVRHENGLAVALAIATVLAVIVRLDMTFGEKQELLTRVREQATTDALTGLGNRRKLLADLGRLLDHPVPSILLIFDLDGFKQYNDSFGHPAGDALLSRLGRRLVDRVERYGSSYRLGGDEFCVLAALADDGAEQVIDAAATALRERGDGFSVGSSFGAVFIPDEAEIAAEALRLADQRLYAQKSGKVSTRGQPHELLLRVLYEREPELHEHVSAVAALAEATGRRLRLSGQAVADLRRAAELHDVGKLAVPDEILRKEGPLDDDEWTFIRRHTLIGQRILSASPALLSIAKVVRSTHERWDGGGYPDGLRGTEIPLAARIVVACDAFVAMTAERPYGRAMTVAEARAELRRCSGTQFDPGVVDAVCAETRERAAAGA